MEFVEGKFVTAYVKYAFSSVEVGPQFREDWVTCRLNIKTPDLRFIEIYCEPLKFGRHIPFKTVVNSNVRIEKALSSTEPHVFTMIWYNENQKFQLFITIKDAETFNKYFNYLTTLKTICSIRKDGEETRNEEQIEVGTHRFDCAKEIVQKTKRGFEVLRKMFANTKCRIKCNKISCVNSNIYTMQDSLSLST